MLNLLADENVLLSYHAYCSSCNVIIICCFRLELESRLSWKVKSEHMMSGRSLKRISVKRNCGSFTDGRRVAEEELQSIRLYMHMFLTSFWNNFITNKHCKTATEYSHIIFAHLSHIFEFFWYLCWKSVGLIYVCVCILLCSVSLICMSVLSTNITLLTTVTSE